MSTTINLALPYLVASQAQKEVTHNEALADLDALAQAVCISRSVSTPPASPAEGDVYIVGASPSGAWVGKANCVAIYIGGWRLKAPAAGWRVWCKAESRLLVYSGTAWLVLGASLLEASFSWTPGSVANASGVTSAAVTVTGAAFGDYVVVAAPSSMLGLVSSAYVGAANTVYVRLANLTGSAVTAPSGTWRVRVMKN